MCGVSGSWSDWPLRERSLLPESAFSTNTRGHQERVDLYRKSSSDFSKPRFRNDEYCASCTCRVRRGYSKTGASLWGDGSGHGADVDVV